LKHHCKRLKTFSTTPESCFRDQGVGGSNPLSPTNLIENKYFASYENWNESLGRGQGIRFSATRTHLSKGFNELSLNLGVIFFCGDLQKGLTFLPYGVRKSSNLYAILRQMA